MSNVLGWFPSEWCHIRGLELTLEVAVKGKEMS